MADDTGPTFDPGGEARSVLQSAVADFGAPVLSNPAIVDGICEDRLPEWPREANLISAAARADVAAMLHQQAGGIGPDTAVRLTAGTLADTRSLDPAACVWVVSEFARALGYQVSDGLRPAGNGGAPPATGNGAVRPGRTDHAAGPGAAQGAVSDEVVADAPDPDPGPARAGDAVTALPADGPPQGAGPTVPPAAGPDRPPSDHPADLGHVPTVTSAAPPGTGAPPPRAGGIPPGAGPPAPPGRPPARTGGRNQKLLVAGGAAAVLVLYFILAGATHLPPFTKASPTPTPAPSQSNPPTPRPTPSTPSPSPSPHLTGPQRTLSALIPGDVQADNSCRPGSGGQFGSGGQIDAEIDCSGAPSIAPERVDYYLFSTPAALNSAYQHFVSTFAGTSENTGPCSKLTGSASFRTFAPCETDFALSRNRSTSGRVAEYFYKNRFSNISTTYSSKLVLVDMTASKSNGNALLAFWQRNIDDWLLVGH
jgi:hypothetical protein